MKTIIAALVLGSAIVVTHRLSSGGAAPTAEEKAKGDIERLRAELAWYRWYLAEYAAAMRLSQYGKPTLGINRLIYLYRDEFIPIESVTVGQVCPAESHGALTREHIYFAARVLPLPYTGGLDLYAVSYLGNADFVHNAQAFDAVIDTKALISERHHIDRPHGLAAAWLARNSWQDFRFDDPRNDHGWSAKLSYNVGDLDGDGRADFVFGRSLVLSGRGYTIAAEAPRRALFFNGAILAVQGTRITRHAWNGNELVETGGIELRRSPHPAVPYVLLPMPGNRVAIRTESGLDIYEVGDETIDWFAGIEGLAPGEAQTGAFGDFTGDGVDDVWLAQVATPTPYPDKLDQIVLIRMADIKAGHNDLHEIAWFTVRGSARYSDYDGIGTSLSPRAGDILGDGRPDLSFTGHRHMNESGALYILPGKGIHRGGATDISGTGVIRILGRLMSMIAPPFHHWDADDLLGDGYADIVMPVDNDLCAGLNAGAVYTLSGKRISELWAKRTAESSSP